MAGVLFNLPQSTVFSEGTTTPGAKVFFYEDGTTTKQAIYTTSDLSVARENPVEADAYGKLPAIFLDPSLGDYKVVVAPRDDTDPPESSFETHDNIPTGLSQAAIADSLHPITSIETALGITEVNSVYRTGDLRRYRALIDGVSDDTVSVGQWLDVGMQGVALVHPGGNVKVTTWVQKSVPSNLNITGYGDAKITGDFTLDFLKPEGGSIKIEGVAFSIWNHVIQNDTLDAGTTPSLILRNCSFSDVLLYPVYIERPVTRAEITDNYFKDIFTGCVLIGENVYASQNNWKNLTVSRNTAININNSGAGNTHFAVLFGRNVIVTDNYIENVTSNSGEAWGIYTKARYTIISENEVNGISSTSSNAIAIVIKGDVRGVTSIPQGYNAQITGNNLYGSGSGIGISCQCEDINVSSNTVENFKEQVSTAGGSDNISIVSNKLIGSGKTSNVWGVNANNSGDNVKIANNHIRLCGDGIRTAVATEQKNWDITDNNISNCLNYAIEMQNTSTLSGINVKGNIVDGCAQFLYMGNCDDFQVSGNKWANLTGSPEDAINFNGVTNGVGVIDQKGLYVQTTDGSTTTVYQMEIPNDVVWKIEATVVARETDDSNRNLYKLGGLFYASSGTAAQQGTTYNLITAIESDAAWNVTLDVTSNLARVRVVGASSTTIDWRASIVAEAA